MIPIATAAIPAGRLRKTAVPIAGASEQAKARRIMSVRVWLLNGALVAVAGTAGLTVLRHLEPIDAPLRIPWWLLAGMFFVVESFVVHVHFRRDSQSFSLSEIPLVLGLFFTGPGGLIAAQLVGSAVALATIRRQRPLKFVFNVANLGLQAILASIVFRALLGPGDAFGLRGWLASFGGVTAAAVVGVATVVSVISLAEGELRRKMVPRVLAIGLTVALANTSLALLGVSILKLDPRAVWLLGIPAITVFLSYRAYTAQRQKHESLEALTDSTRLFQSSLAEKDSTVIGILSHAREMFRADVCSITMFPSEEENESVVSTVGPGDTIEHRVPRLLDPTDGVWDRVASRGQSLLLPRPIRNEQLRATFAAQGIVDAMVVPLRAGNQIFGTMLVGNRLGDATTFTGGDVQLLETFANHASLTLENVRLVGRLQRALERQTELNRMKDEFVATVTHELRTPLTSIQGFVKTLIRREVTPSPEDLRGYFEIIDRQSDRLRAMIEDLLTVSRIESREHRASPRMVRVPGIAQQVVEESPARTKGRTINVVFAPDFPAVWSDDVSLHRIIANLVDNALKHAPGDTAVTISGRLDGEDVIVSVEDEGPGVPEHLQDRIWDRFVQGDQSSTRKVGGAGLGLYICRQLADSFGGHVWLERSGPSGSVFSLRVPGVKEGPSAKTGETAPARLIRSG